MIERISARQHTGIDMNLLRFIGLLGLVAVTGGCANQPASTSTGSATPANFDGRYTGSIQVSGAASGADPQQCATDPRLSVQVTNNAFSYVQSHPNAANTALGFTPEAVSATYTATIDPDGSVSGDSGDLNGVIVGRVSGTHMTGTISGLLCFYTFSVNRA